MPLNLPLRCSNCGKDVTGEEWTNYADLMVACPDCLSAAATARPDWEAIARELYEVVGGLSVNAGSTPHDTAVRLGAVLQAFERASLGEGSGEAENG